MVFHVTATFPFAAGQGAVFVSKFAEADGFPVTTAAKGMLGVKMFTSVEQPDTVIVWEKWAAEADFDAYMKMRTDTGYVAGLPEMTGPPSFVKSMLIDIGKPKLGAPDGKVGFYKTAVLPFKAGKGTEWVKDFLVADDGVKATAGSAGLVNIKFFQDASNKDTMVIWEEWESEANFKDYFNMRVSTGYVPKWFGAEFANFTGPPGMHSCVRKFNWCGDSENAVMH